jgi:hypothetical protein
MADIIKFRKRKPSEKHRGKTLCRSGFHQWQTLNEKRFDVKQGKLVTVQRCRRCGKQKITAL